MFSFNKGKIQDRFFTPDKAMKKEPDLRYELKKIIYQENRGQYVVYRRARRDENQAPILSNAANSNRSSEVLFKGNEGMKYLFDDYLIQGVLALSGINHETGVVKGYGDSRTDGRVLYLEHDILSRATNNSFDMPDEHDKIIVPMYDIEGKLKSPLTIDEQFQVGVVEPFRLNSIGRIEYFKLRLLSQFDRSLTT
jgi:hypothetical protein